MPIGAIASSLLSAVTSSSTVEGYCWPLSVRPGSSLSFHVSASVPYHVDIVQLSGEDDTAIGPVMTRIGPQPPRVQPASTLAWRDGCGWAPSFALAVPSSWPSGLYAARLQGSDGGPPEFVPFVVRPGSRSRADHLLLANPLTWTAYNEWGGRSRYTDPGNVFRLSLLRPNPGASPLAPYSAEGQAAHLLRAESWVWAWMRTDHRVDVAADLDLHVGRIDLGRYASIVLNTHPEYWTQNMVDALRRYLDQGGCLLYLGGNGLFERVSLDASGQTLVFFDGETTPHSVRDRMYFRNLTPPQPERALLGVAFLYDNYFSDPAPFAVLEPDHRFFAGTGVQYMALIGRHGRNGGASGREMDSSRAGTAPAGTVVNAWVPYTDRAGSDRGVAPSNLRVLARGTNEQRDGPHAAEMTCHDTLGGGFVFAAGSMTFGGSLVVDPILQRIVGNVLAEAVQVRRRR